MTYALQRSRAVLPRGGAGGATLTLSRRKGRWWLCSLGKRTLGSR
jgi:hypothetical protein